MGKDVKPVQLNLGSGSTLLKDFINVDIAYKLKAKNYVEADIRDLPFPDNYADYILARQVLEHIPFLNVMNTLVEWVRVLKPGGRMVITCPNFNLMCQDFLNTEFNFQDFYEASKGFYGNQSHEHDFHITPINPEFLTYLLGQLPVKGTIKSYSRGSECVSYPGYKFPKGHVYRFGEIHADVTKWDKQS